MFTEIKNNLKQRYPQLLKMRRAATLVNWWRMDVSSALFSTSTKLVMTPYGFKLAGTNSIHHLAMQRGEFELAETELFRDFFGDSDVFVDVGANIGFYTCLARMAGKKVVAVEPLPKNLKHLQANLLANDWSDVEVFPVGLSDHPGLATLYGGSSTGASLIASWAGASKMFRQVIAISTLDILLGNRFASKKIFIKIDVEGVEYPVILGAAGVMRMDPKPIWVIEICLNEFHPDGINKDFRKIFEVFWQHGYEARTADHQDKLILPADVKKWVECGRCDSGTINYKFISVK